MNTQELHESILSNAQFTFSRSGGKGGQNVNKVNTKVHLVLPVCSIEGITQEERERIRTRLKSIINSEDNLYIDVDDERTQELNRKIALSRIEDRIVTASKIPKKRKKTKPTLASKEKKLKLKHLRSELKRNRAKIIF